MTDVRKSGRQERFDRAGGVFRALRHRNYRLFYAGQGISLIGTWMQRIALSWLVYERTGSVALLGIVGFSGQIMTFAAAPFAGVLADRVNRRRLLVATQTVAMVQAFVLAGLTYTDAISVWHIIGLSIMLGLVNGFDIPIRQSFVVEMVEGREDLPNAIALNSSMVNGAKLVGPSLAGVLIALVGEAMCFFVNGLSFVAVIVALLAMRVQPRERHAQEAHVLRHMKDGFAYAFGFMPIRSILLLLALVSLLGMSYTTLLPAVAKDILHGDARTLGFLMGSGGVGALFGAIFLAARKDTRGLVRVIAIASVLFGAALVGFAVVLFGVVLLGVPFSISFVISVVLLAVAGAGSMIQMASSNTVLQTIVDEDKRGRVMSFYTMAFMGMGPFGSLLAGFLAHWIGIPLTIAITGGGSIAAALVFASWLPAMNRKVHRIYAQRKLVPVPAVAGNGESVPLVGKQ